MTKNTPPFVVFSLKAVLNTAEQPPLHNGIESIGRSLTKDSFLSLFEARLSWHWYPIVSAGLASFPTFEDLLAVLDDSLRLKAIGWSAQLAATADGERFVSALGLLSLLCRTATNRQPVEELTEHLLEIRSKVSLNAIDKNVPYWFSRIAAYQLATGVLPSGYTGAFTVDALNPETTTGFSAAEFTRAQILGRIAEPRETLGRFLLIHETEYQSALEELRAGLKEGHWIWYIFPQLRGLGESYKSHYYGLRDIDEAREYREHPLLGQRLTECVEALLSVNGRPILSILGSPDNLKFRSCLTLFEQVAGGGGIFTQALEKYFGGQRDPRTQQILQAAPRR